MATPQEDKTPSTPESTPKKKGSKLLILGIPAFVLLMGGGAGAWWFLNKPPAEGAEVETHEETEPGLLALSSFVVNLSDVGGRKYLRVTMSLLLPDEAAAKTIEGSELTMSRLRAAIIEVLTMRTSVQLSTPEGRTALRAAVAEAAKTVAHLEVKDVLFQEFIVQ